MDRTTTGPGPMRPNVMATRHAIAAGHYLAAQAGFQVLEAGGNAIDGGVAAGIALSVVESEMVSFAGVAPILIYIAERDEIVTISGLGTWPKAASCDYFRRHHGGAIPKGVLRSVVPAAPDAWLTALERYGTISFAEAAAAAIRLARDGFAMYELMAERTADVKDTIAQWPSSAAIYLPGGRPPVPGEVFRQMDLARTLQFLADEEKAHARKGRAAGLDAVRRAFYRGDIAQTIDRFYREQGGLLTAEDLAGFRVGIEPPVRIDFHGTEVYNCGPWCQGPMLLEALAILEDIDLKAMGHNSVAYLHAITEAIKLAAADREAFIGDPRFVDVPIDTLLSRDYAALRRRDLRPDRAWPDMPPAGRLSGGSARAVGNVSSALPGLGDRLDTSYVCAVDRHGNAFSATPSDSGFGAPVVPGLGFVVSPRGSQSWTDPAHPSSIAPGKRPRLTPNPALAIRRGEYVMPFGTPGGDTQVQVMLQVFLNMAVFGMDPQTALEAPRIATHSFPASFDPHDRHPASLYLEGRMSRRDADALAALGHKIYWWPERGPSYTSQDINGACVIRRDLKTGIMAAAADPRRTAYAVGW